MTLERITRPKLKTQHYENLDLRLGASGTTDSFKVIEQEISQEYYIIVNRPTLVVLNSEGQES